MKRMFNYVRNINRFNEIIVLLFLGVLLGVASFFGFQMVCTILLFIILLMIIWRTKNKIVIAAFLIRVAIQLMNYSFSILEPKGTSVGYMTILERARFSLLTQGDLSNVFYQSGSSSFPYLILLYPFAVIFGAFIINFFIINSFLGALAVFNVFRISDRVFGKKTAIISSLIFCFSPYIAYMNGVFSRDPLILLITTQIIYLLVDMAKKNTLRPSIFVFLGLLFFLRVESLLIIAFGFVAYKFIQIKDIRKNVLLIAAAVILVIFLLSNLTVYMFPRGDSPVNTLDEFRDYRSHGRSVYLKHHQYNTLLDIVYYLPSRFVYFAYSPLPHQIEKPRDLLGLVDSAILIMLTIFAFLSKKTILRDKQALLMLIILLTGFAASSIIEGNVGAAMRHRMQYSFILYILGSYYLSKHLKIPALDRLIKKRII